MLIALKLNWANPPGRPVGMLRDIFWLSAGQAIAMTNTQKDTRVDVKEIVAVEDGLLIKYLPDSEKTAQLFRTTVRERIRANSEAQGLFSIEDEDLFTEKRTGSLH
jgi:hypothetical protein